MNPEDEKEEKRNSTIIKGALIGALSTILAALIGGFFGIFDSRVAESLLFPNVSEPVSLPIVAESTFTAAPVSPSLTPNSSLKADNPTPNIVIVDTPTPTSYALVTSWEFDSVGNIGGWGANSWDTEGLGKLSVVNGALTYDVTARDSFMYIRNLNIDADRVSLILISMKVSAGDNAILFFGTNSDPDTGEHGKMYPFIVQPDKEYFVYQIYPQSNQSWKGVITELRIDNTGPAKVEIDYIRLLEAVQN